MSTESEGVKGRNCALESSLCVQDCS